MASLSRAPAGERISFGPFTLIASERLLLKAGRPVELGARTLDVLLALTSRPHEAVSKRDLMALVWPDVTVEEGSLRFHVAALRKALGDGKDDARYIATLAGRGYCFVAPTSASADPAPTQASAPPLISRSYLPARIIRMIGRDDTVRTLSGELPASRFITIVGPGGVGKTTVAVAVAHDLAEAFEGAILFVDLAALSDPTFVAASVAASLGLSVQSDDPAPSIVAFLRDKRVLLILDNCEHLIEAAAGLAARIMAGAPEVHLLATSREALRVEGEHVRRLATLAVPTDAPELTAADALNYSAPQLFLDRALASGARLELDDESVTLISGICRKLDGLPLAIELAVGRVQAYGLQQTASLLDQRLSLLWGGKRTAPPRQKTLQATLDWSYQLLTDDERRVLGRLTVFVGQFTLEAALAVVPDLNLDDGLLIATVDGLVAKSMIAAHPVGATMHYRLLETTRTYARDIGLERTELADVSARHARYWQRWLEPPQASPSAAERAAYLARLGDVRSALEWCFGPDGDPVIGVGLAAAAAPVFLAISLFTECSRWSKSALLALDAGGRGGTDEMRLQAALGLSLIFTRGETEAARKAAGRSLDIAGRRRDALSQVQSLALLHMFHHRTGDFRTALDYGRQALACAEAMKDPVAAGIGHCAVGVSLHHMGDIRGAGAELEAALQYARAAARPSMIYLGFSHANWASGTLARNLWLEGRPDEAEERARQSVDAAALLGRPISLSIAFNCAVTVFLWIGDLKRAEHYTEQLVAHAESHSLTPFRAVGRGFRGELSLRRNDAEFAVQELRACLSDLEAARYTLLATPFTISLAEGLASIGRSAEAMVLLDERIRHDETTGALAYLPELLRMRGAITHRADASKRAEAERCFRQSLEWSRKLGTPAWSLRAGSDLERMPIEQRGS